MDYCAFMRIIVLNCAVCLFYATKLRKDISFLFESNVETTQKVLAENVEKGNYINVVVRLNPAPPCY